MGGWVLPYEQEHGKVLWWHGASESEKASIIRRAPRIARVKVCILGWSSGEAARREIEKGIEDAGLVSEVVEVWVEKVDETTLLCDIVVVGGEDFMSSKSKSSSVGLPESLALFGGLLLSFANRIPVGNRARVVGIHDDGQNYLKAAIIG